MRETSTKLLLAAAGIIFGIAISLVMQPSKTTAQSVRDSGTFQILGVLGAGGAVAVIWRINTATGELELCHASNYSNWLATIRQLPEPSVGVTWVDPSSPPKPVGDLGGHCAAMPRPSN